MVGIAAKLGAALQGFWWALDEHERRLILLGTVWAGLVVLELASEHERRTRREELRTEIRNLVREEVHGGRAG